MGHITFESFDTIFFAELFLIKLNLTGIELCHSISLWSEYGLLLDNSKTYIKKKITCLEVGLLMYIEYSSAA